MRYGFREVCLDHDPGDRHPESPDRLRAIRRALAECHGVEYVQAPDADETVLAAVHDREFLDAVETFCADGGGRWDADTIAVEATWDAALASAGLAQWTARTALDGATNPETPFALGRPPGHHAVADDAMGFCFLNNAAVGAQAALDAGAERVAILDWDVHHGNGTQEIFYERGEVFYASLHEKGLYPGTGAVEETGVGPGADTTLNVPFPPGSDTADYLAAVDEAIVPAITAFDPDLVLVSAGFDAHEDDPISRMRVSVEGFGCLAARVRDLARETDAGLGFVLEGGYGLDTLARSVTTVHEVFDGYEPEEPDEEVSDGAREVLEALADQGFDGE